MEKHRSSALLKTMAKGQLLGKYPPLAVTFFLVILLSAIMQFLPFYISSLNSFLGYIVNRILSLFVSLTLGVIYAGLAYISLKICCKEPFRISDIFYGFQYQPNKIFTIQLVIAAAGIITGLPADIFQQLYISNPTTVSLRIVSILLSLLGFIVFFYIYLHLSQAVFLWLDFSDRTPSELLHMSQVLMRGHKKRLFFIWLSFVPLLLLGLFTCCIGFLWLLPYLNVTMANFYMDLMQNQTANHTKPPQ